MVSSTKMEFKRYRRSQIAELADWSPDVDMTGVSVSVPDAAAGSPKVGDKIARNPVNHEDRWLVAAEYFAANFEPEFEPESEPESEPVEDGDVRFWIEHDTEFAMLTASDFRAAMSERDAFRTQNELLRALIDKHNDECRECHV